MSASEPADERERPATMLEPTSFDDSDDQLRALNSEALAYRRTIERLTADRDRLLAALTQANEDTRYWMRQWAENHTEVGRQWAGGVAPDVPTLARELHTLIRNGKQFPYADAEEQRYYELVVTRWLEKVPPAPVPDQLTIAERARAMGIKPHDDEVDLATERPLSAPDRPDETQEKS